MNIKGAAAVGAVAAGILFVAGPITPAWNSMSRDLPGTRPAVTGTYTGTYTGTAPACLGADHRLPAHADICYFIPTP